MNTNRDAAYHSFNDSFYLIQSQARKNLGHEFIIENLELYFYSANDCSRKSTCKVFFGNSVKLKIISFGIEGIHILTTMIK